jgi:hypothetical protein
MAGVDVHITILLAEFVKPSLARVVNPNQDPYKMPTPNH